MKRPAVASPQSAAAILGISASLLLAGVLGTIAVHAAQLDGRSGELAVYLEQADSRLSLQGVVLAGLVRGGEDLPFTPATVLNRGDVLKLAGAKADVERAGRAVGYIDRPTAEEGKSRCRARG